MANLRVELRPALLPEWASEQKLAGRLGAPLERADPEQAQSIFNQVDISLPQDIAQRYLAGLKAGTSTPLNEELLPDPTRYDYYLLEVPVTIFVPPDHSLVWLGLLLDMQGDPPDPGNLVLPYSLFPTSEWKEKDWDLGSLSLDTSKALSALLPGLGKFAEALDFKVKFPIQWKTYRPTIVTSGNLRNPAKWLVKDEAITSGFNAYTIVRAPKGLPVAINASLQAVVRKKSLFASAQTPTTSSVRYRLARPAA
jgi:hypothetical protein